MHVARRTQLSVVALVALACVSLAAEPRAARAGDGGKVTLRITQPQWLKAMNARGDGLNRKYGLGQYALPAAVVSEKTAGLQQPTQTEPTVVATSDSNFNWGDAGIGAGIVAAGILVGLGGAFAVRHRRDPLAH